jgi:uncharacterized RDD family membrane protein YckC
MTENPDVIEEYARKFERHLTGSAHDRARSTAELVAHLSDAAEAGELVDALSRLGDPETAARAFASANPLRPAPLSRRLAAAGIDAIPIVAVTIALAVPEFIRGKNIQVMFPPFIPGPSEGPLRTVGIPLALAWSVLALGFLESLTGATPGKWLLRLRTVTNRGLRVPLAMAVVRRLSFLAGPLAWLDWCLALRPQRLRGLDQLTRTMVVSLVRLAIER